MPSEEIRLSEHKRTAVDAHIHREADSTFVHEEGEHPLLSILVACADRLYRVYSACYVQVKYIQHNKRKKFEESGI